jgi:histidinol-phosphate aminotransferase
MQNTPIYLDRNENNYGPAPKCFEVLKNADLTKISWYTRAYQFGVKSILSQKIGEMLDYPEEKVILGYGAEDLLKQSVQCYLGKHEKLMIPSYSWWYYKKMADEVGGSNIEYELDIGEDSFHYNIKTFLELYHKEKPQMVFISSPNNPTGNSISKNDFKSLLSEIKDSIIVLDEAYSTDGFTPQTKELLESNPNLIIIRTFSKYFALAGLRIGYALIGDNIKNLSKFTNRYLGYNRLNEEIAIAALESQDYYKDVADKMNEDINMYYTELGKLPGFTPYKSDANFILVKIQKDIKEPLKQFLNERGLIIKFMNEDRLNSHLRITIGTQEENKMIADAIKEFSTVQQAL